MTERAQHLLRVLVQRYIRDGQPVGSRALTKDSGLDLSAATIRNVMADLEELGYIKAPHTSAGRVPTDAGYRVFVDSLLTIRPLSERAIERVKLGLETETDRESLISSASNLLSGLTRMAGVVTLPRRNHSSLRRIEFLPLSNNRILVILIINEQEVQNRVISTERDYSAAELEQAANYLNSSFMGQDFNAVRRSLVNSMQSDREEVDRLMRTVVDVAGKVFAEDPEDEDYVVAGQTNLMDFAELSSVDKLRVLFEAFTRKRDILHLLDQCLRADGVQIFIGHESGYEVFDGCSLVTSSYSAEGKVLGVLGVIGPTRMDYDRIIPIVDVTAKLLGHALNPSS